MKRLGTIAKQLTRLGMNDRFSLTPAGRAALEAANNSPAKNEPAKDVPGRIIARAAKGSTECRH